MIWIALLSVLFAWPVKAEEPKTTFRIYADSVEKGSSTIRVLTDKQTEVGGLRLHLTYSPEHWQAEEASLSAVSAADVQINSEVGEIVFVWDTVSNESLPTELLCVTLKKTGSKKPDITLSIDEYYDSTLAMNDLLYTIEGNATAEGSASVLRFLWWLIPVAAIVLMAAGGGVWLILRKKSANR